MVVGETRDGDEAIQLVADLKPRLVLIEGNIRGV